MAWLILPVPRNAIFSKMLEVDAVDEKALDSSVRRRFERWRVVVEMRPLAIMFIGKAVDREVVVLSGFGLISIMRTILWRLLHVVIELRLSLV